MIKVIIKQTESERIKSTRQYCLGKIDLMIQFSDFSIENIVREYLKFPYQVLIISDVPDLEVPQLYNQLSEETIHAWIEEINQDKSLPNLDYLILVKNYPATDLIKQGYAENDI